MTTAAKWRWAGCAVTAGVLAMAPAGPAMAQEGPWLARCPRPNGGLRSRKPRSSFSELPPAAPDAVPDER